MESLYNVNNFEWDIYLLCNPDLKKNNINTKEQAFIHFKNYGINENRFININLLKLYYFNDWVKYKNTYFTLQKISIDECFFYYIKKGITEEHIIHLKEYDTEKIINFFTLNINNLKYYNIFNQYNWTIYRNDNNLHHIKNDIDGFLHYISNGKINNLKITKNIFPITYFNSNFYKKINNNGNNENLLKKYIIKKDFSMYYNIIEQYLFENYDWNMYLNNNKDLNKVYKKELDGFKHYIKHGFSEKREIYDNNLLEKTYNWNLYQQINSELNNMSIKQLIDHYIQHGKYEKRILILHKNKENEKFINDNKKLINNDINFMINNIELRPENFDFNFYIEMNLDLKKNIKEENNGFIHYLEYGKKEKRLYNKQQEYIYKHYYFDNFIKKYNLNTSISKKELIRLYFQKINFYLPKFFIIKNRNTTIVKESIKFSFAISSFNNEKNILDNLVSIILQSYSNWEIFYTNDNSNDRTEEYFHFIVKKYNIQDKVTYIKNNENMKQAYSKFHMYQKIDKNNVIIILDGDDWLYHSEVLNDLYDLYTKKHCNMTYSKFYYYTENKILRPVNLQKIPKDIIQFNNYRKYKWCFSHLRTGYAWLFKMIPQNYLMYQNKWLDRCTDWAELYCVAELAEGKIEAIDDVQVVYNKNNSLLYKNSYYTDHLSQERKNIENYIVNLPKLIKMIPDIYIINLPHETELKNKLTKQLNKYDIKNYHFFEAHNAYKYEESKQIYEKYKENYKNNKIPRKIFGVEKEHINNLSALGVIQSTLKLYEFINNTTNLDHVIILEDDVYFKKKILKEIHITNVDLNDCDFMYIGHNCLSKDLLNIRKQNKNIIDLNKECPNINIYGAYGFICSRNFRSFVLSKGIDYFINQNLNLDCFYITLYKDTTNNLKIKLYNDHLVIPEVRKDGIQNKRGNEFYEDRSIDLDNYDIF